MQRSAGGYGEDSSLKNPAHNDLPIPSPGYDVEKTAINSSGDSIAKDVAIKTKSPSHQNGQGLFDEKPTPESDASTLTEEKDDFPEGGVRGYSVVIGAFCGLFSVFGIINSTGILLEYFSTHQLKDYTSSQIGWYVYLSAPRFSLLFRLGNADSKKDLRTLLVLDVLLRSSNWPLI
jgi:hypothetical protein